MKISVTIAFVSDPENQSAQQNDAVEKRTSIISIGNSGMEKKSSATFVELRAIIGSNSVGCLLFKFFVVINI